MADLIRVAARRLRDGVQGTFALAGLRLQRIPRPDLSLYARYPEASRLDKRFYNVGAAGFWHPYWTNLDYFTDHYGSLQHDCIGYDLMALGELPIASGVAEVIYTSHTMEHVTDKAACTFFREAHRALKPGGVFRITGPDAMLDYAAWKRGDRDHWYTAPWYDNQWSDQYTMPPSKASITQLFLYQMASQASVLSPDPTATHRFSDGEVETLFATSSVEDALNTLTSVVRYNPDHPGHHVSWWSHALAIRMLMDAGFTTVYPSGYGQSRCAPLRDTNYFDSTHPKLSFYVEALR